MAKLPVQSMRAVVPMIYAYTTPEIKRHNGWIKIGYTEQNVEDRIRQQTQTADVVFKLEWTGNAQYDDGSGDTFRDSDFHAYLQKLNVERKPQTEWFLLSAKESKHRFQEFRSNRGRINSEREPDPYTLRAEQTDAVNQTANYFLDNPGSEFLWNAKPRFGKTLAVYDFIKTIDAQNVLIVTNRPAIANSWYDDYEKFLGTQSNYYFVSETDSLRGKPLVCTRKQYLSVPIPEDSDDVPHCITFLSLQDLKGSKYFGGDYDKLKEISEIQWDVLVIDEAHEGVETLKTDIAFDNIQRQFTLHLSGTPFKALANDKFPESAIYNWTYKDEQTARQNWNDSEAENPYAVLPRLNLFTYQMSEMIREELEQGVDVDGEQVAYAFDLNEFFKTEGSGFVHEKAVDSFLDALTTQTKYPFSTPELRNELKHTFWLLNRVDSAKALEKKLKKHPIFSEYEIVMAVGSGSNRNTEDDSDEETETKKSFDRVTKAIELYDKTITLSVGQLTTGVTIPQWSGVLMLSSIKSPALYMQAAFRAQNPYLARVANKKGKPEFRRKENAYVFDFDPARTLEIFEQFANDLSSNTTQGRGDSQTRAQNVRELLNFFPVLGEDEQGEMVELDAEKVLSIPRKIRSVEVVKRGFMSNFLFQNIGYVFHAPKEVVEILEKLSPCEEQQRPLAVIPGVTETELSLDENGDVDLDNNWVIGKSNELFGDKIYDDCHDQILARIEPTLTQENPSNSKQLATIKENFKTTLTQQLARPIIDKVKEEYGKDLPKSTQRQIERQLDNLIKTDTEKTFSKFKIDDVPLNKENILEALTQTADNIFQTATQSVTETIETNKRERQKEELEDDIRDHLRGFTRTIPAFLMAYGTDDVTLDNFDMIIPDDVFQEVTGITLDQFRFLRDGGDYVEKDTGIQKHFNGHLFDEVVFNDSVKEFMRLRTELADYFDENVTGDIFDYIPPQKTNQIFTPKAIVREMVDHLEHEKPGCFDDPTTTFIDPYMKSGLFVAEIVKRLYQSKKLKRHIPDAEQRLKHIFENQVFGLAPTEIIYRIATNFILGTHRDTIKKHHFRILDSLQATRAGNLESEIDRVMAEEPEE